jgi:hypothetical protein
MSENSEIEMEATYGQPKYEVTVEVRPDRDYVLVYEVTDFGPDKDDEPTLERREIFSIAKRDADDVTYALVQAGYGPPKAMFGMNDEYIDAVVAAVVEGIQLRGAVSIVEHALDSVGAPSMVNYPMPERLGVRITELSGRLTGLVPSHQPETSETGGAEYGFPMDT